MPNAQDYFAAAKIIRDEWGYNTSWSAGKAAEYLEAKAQRLAKRECYTVALGRIGQDDTPLERGRKLTTWLLDAGWKPPNGTIL